MKSSNSNMTIVALTSAITVAVVLVIAGFIYGLNTPTERIQKTTPTPQISTEKPGLPSDSSVTKESSAVETRTVLTHKGKECTRDCGGHEAGYEWAEDHGIDDIDDCGGKSDSFIEGCESYVEENGSISSDDDEGN